MSENQVISKRAGNGSETSKLLVRGGLLGAVHIAIIESKLGKVTGPVRDELVSRVRMSVLDMAGHFF